MTSYLIVRHKVRDFSEWKPGYDIRFLEKRSCDQRAALGLTIGGIPAMLLAAFTVKSLSLDAIRWLVMAIIVYTAVTMLQSARAERRRQSLGLRQAHFQTGFRINEQ